MHCTINRRLKTPIKMSFWQAALLLRIVRPIDTRKGAVHKGRPQRRGRGVGQIRTYADRWRGGERTLRTSASWYFSVLFQHALQTRSVWMMPIKVQIVIHLIQFAPQSIIWAGTKAYIQLTLRVRLLITSPTYQPTWGRSKMP